MPALSTGIGNARTLHGCSRGVCGFVFAGTPSRTAGGATGTERGISLVGRSQGQLANALRGHDPIAAPVVNRLRDVLLA